MSGSPESVAAFLQGKRLAVARVSRHSAEAANAVFLKLKQTGDTVYPVNPNAAAVEGERCFPCMRWWLQKRGRLPR